MKHAVKKFEVCLISPSKIDERLDYCLGMFMLHIAFALLHSLLADVEKQSASFGFIIKEPYTFKNLEHGSFLKSSTVTLVKQNYI